MIEVVFEGINHLNQKEMNEFHGGSDPQGCSCCMCRPNVEGAGDVTAEHEAGG